MVDSNTELEMPSSLQRRLLKDSDVAQVVPILKQWIRDWKTGEVIQEEVDEVEEKMYGSLRGINESVYLVAELDGKVVGLVSIKPPDERMKKFTTSEKARELTNFYIDKNHIHKGIGTALYHEARKKTLEIGFDQIVLNSGPRYKETAWGFYDKLPGLKRVGIAKDMYGPGIEAPVWREDIK